MLEFLSNTINRSNHIICLDYVSMNLSQSIARTKKIITYKRTTTNWCKTYLAQWLVYRHHDFPSHNIFLQATKEEENDSCVVSILLLLSKHHHEIIVSGTPRGRTVRPPSLRTIRQNSETQLMMMNSPSPRTRRSSGHASDSELP